MSSVPHAIAQQAADTAAADTTGGAESALASRGVWGFIEQAGGFQYPIFALLVIGLFLISAKIYELYMDRTAAEELEEASISEMDMKRITMLVANQQKSMLADLQARMLNVFQTTEDAGTLHEEIANFIQFQRERFETFTRRINFLADTAGAVGLLGTVWGMLTLFYGGNVSDKQEILTGMGVALISTLLGLIVSITLNLISTEVYSFFDKRIDQIEEEADELRFRLMELSLSGNGTRDDSGRTAPARTEGTEKRMRGRQESPVPEGTSYSKSEEAGRSGAPEELSTKTAPPTGPTTDTAEPTPHQLEVSNLPDSPTVGSTIQNVRLKVTAEDGSPVPDEPVHVRSSGSGTLEEGTSETTLRTNSEGAVTFDWHLPEEPGIRRLNADVPSSSSSRTTRRLSVKVQPGSPAQYEQDGNNQGAELGSTLPKPLAIKLFDAHDNPVPDQAVRFRVESGDGSFVGGGTERKVSTGEDGIAAVKYSVGEEPGLNLIVASVGGREVKFQAMALEQ